MVLKQAAKSVFLLFWILLLMGSCRDKGCYFCVLEQINGPDAPVLADSTIHIDTVETCNWKWVKENNVPPEDSYPQSWRCKEI